MITCERYHDFSYGHSVWGHESVCARIHGHNGRVTLTCIQEAGGLDSIGRVIDFGVIKSTLCEWIEDNWDHKTLLWENDPRLARMQEIDPTVVSLPFNPTAEGLANHLLFVVGPGLLVHSGVRLIKVRFDETRKCSATVQL